MNSKRLTTTGNRREQGQARLGTLSALSALVITLLLGASMMPDA